MRVSTYCSREVHLWFLKLGGMSTNYQETGLTVVPCRKADAGVQVFKGKAEEMEALAWCQSMPLFFAQRFETQWVKGSISRCI